MIQNPVNSGVTAVVWNQFPRQPRLKNLLGMHSHFPQNIITCNLRKGFKKISFTAGTDTQQEFNITLHLQTYTFHIHTEEKSCLMFNVHWSEATSSINPFPAKKWMCHGLNLGSSTCKDDFLSLNYKPSIMADILKMYIQWAEMVFFPSCYLKQCYYAYSSKHLLSDILQ